MRRRYLKLIILFGVDSETRLASLPGPCSMGGKVTGKQYGGRIVSRFDRGAIRSRQYAGF